MKPLLLLSTLTLSILSISSAAALPPAQIPLPLTPRPPIMLPSPHDDGTSATPQVQRSVTISDILGTQRSVTSYWAFARQNDAIERLLSSTDSNDSGAGGNITVLAPLNSAVEGLPHKPWEDPREYATYGSQAYEGSGGKTRADDNIRRFAEAHIVVLGGRASWAEGVDAETLSGRRIRWEAGGDGRRVILPDGVEVERVASQVSNGELWILKGVLNYES